MDQVIGFTVQMQVGGWMYCVFIVGLWLGYMLHSFFDWLHESDKAEKEAKQNMLEADQNVKEAEKILADCNKEKKV